MPETINNCYVVTTSTDEQLANIFQEKGKNWHGGGHMTLRITTSGYVSKEMVSW